MQLHIVDGRLGKDAEVKTDKNGRNYVRFSLANRVFRNGEETTVWYDVISNVDHIVTKQAEYLKKGGYVIVTGSLSVDTRLSDGTVYTNLTLRADKVDFASLGKKDDSTTTSTTSTSPAPQKNTTVEPQNVFSSSQVMPDVVTAPSGATLSDEGEDDLPF